MASKKKTDAPAGSGDTVELADKHTGFYDPKTGLKLVHDQQVPLGETVGEETRLALLSGRLLIVGGKKADPADDE